jgi:glycosyltransferase involved in cell wall biosynthesis
MLFTLGRLVELKGHRHLIDALAILNAELRPHLVIGGDGPLRCQLEEHARSRGLADNVTFTGTLPHHMTPAYYAASHIYVQPSIIDSDGNTEGLGLAVMEAMSCGTPCIGSRVGGIPDIITDGTNGFLVNQADPSAMASAIATLLGNEALRIQMGRQARQTVLDKFSWESTALDLIDVYESILHEPGK